MKYRIFISSVQKEFAKERQAIVRFLRGDFILGRYFEPFIFEELPAKDKIPDETYTEEVKQSDVYIALIGKELGYLFKNGTTPTMREFETASKNNKTRLIFLLNVKKESRHPKVNKWIKSLSESLIYGKFNEIADLISNVYSSLISFLSENGDLHSEPFDRSVCKNASLNDISNEKIAWFAKIAKSERNFPINFSSGKVDFLTHLNLLNKGKITNAAMLLFGKEPQKFFLASEVKCAHFHGKIVEKPISSYHIYKGNLFELADQAVNFVLSKIDLAIGTRKDGTAVPTAYEIPPEAIEEAVINAIAHRNYDSKASVQVMLFSDRLEISNPGNLPLTLTIENIKQTHTSYPRNPLIAESLYLAHYIEKMGTGIQDIIKRCLDYGLPEPEFKITDGFVITIYRKKGLAANNVIKRTEKDQNSDLIKLSFKATKILNLMRKKPNITQVELSKKVGINEKNIRLHISKLKSKGLLERIGSDKNGYWRIKDYE